MDLFCWMYKNKSKNSLWWSWRNSSHATVLSFVNVITVFLFTSTFIIYITFTLFFLLLSKHIYLCRESMHHEHFWFFLSHMWLCGSSAEAGSDPDLGHEPCLPPEPSTNHNASSKTGWALCDGSWIQTLLAVACVGVILFSDWFNLHPCAAPWRRTRAETAAAHIYNGLLSCKSRAFVLFGTTCRKQFCIRFVYLWSSSNTDP